MYKPERDNLAAMSAASYVPNPAPPAFEGGGPSVAPAPKREPPPGAVPAAFTAKVQRASTVGGTPQSRPQLPQQQTSRPPLPKPAPAPMNRATRPPPTTMMTTTTGPGAPKPVARPVPVQQLPQQQQARQQQQQQQQQPVKKPIQRATTVPNPAVRVGGATTPSIASDDDSLFAAMELPGEEELIGGGNVSVATTAAWGIRDDSGFAEMEGLADSR